MIGNVYVYLQHTSIGYFAEFPASLVVATRQMGKHIGEWIAVKLETTIW